jgi:hypothetical protein
VCCASACIGRLLTGKLPHAASQLGERTKELVRPLTTRVSEVVILSCFLLSRSSSSVRSGWLDPLKSQASNHSARNRTTVHMIRLLACGSPSRGGAAYLAPAVFVPSDPGNRRRYRIATAPAPLAATAPQSQPPHSTRAFLAHGQGLPRPHRRRGRSLRVASLPPPSGSHLLRRAERAVPTTSRFLLASLRGLSRWFARTLSEFMPRFN